MEEDIKVLEEFINNYKQIQEKYKDDEIQAEIERSCYFEEVPAQAIENLIKGYKELEKEYRHLREYINFAPNLDEMSAVKYMEMIKPSYLEGREEEKHRAQQFIEENCIPKSKVREKIEKWESICRGEQLEGLNDNHAEYWSCFEDVLEKIKEQLLEERN